MLETLSAFCFNQATSISLHALNKVSKPLERGRKGKLDNKAHMSK
jgi:hypothetical protein